MVKLKLHKHFASNWKWNDEIKVRYNFWLIICRNNLEQIVPSLHCRILYDHVLWCSNNDGERKPSCYIKPYKWKQTGMMLPIPSRTQHILTSNSVIIWTNCMFMVLITLRPDNFSLEFIHILLMVINWRMIFSFSLLFDFTESFILCYKPLTNRTAECADFRIHNKIILNGMWLYV